MNLSDPWMIEMKKKSKFGWCYSLIIIIYLRLFYILILAKFDIRFKTKILNLKLRF